MALQSTVVRDEAELEAIRPEWETLLAESAADEPMLSPLWLIPWWRVFGSQGGRRLAVLACREEGRLLGLVPLVAREHRYPPGITFRRLEMLGTGEEEADEVGTEYVGAIAARGAEERVAAALSSALAGGALGAWDEIQLSPMDGSSAAPSVLARALEGAGIEVEIESVGSSPYIDLPSSFTAYLGALSSTSRYLVTRSMRDLERWAGGELELSVARTPADLAEGSRILSALHAERWGGGGAFASPRFRDFHEAVMPALFDRGALELSWLSARGAPVAASYGVVWRDKVYFYQTGRALDLPRGVRPGIALHAMLVRRAIEAGRREYDFLEGRSRYKRQLATAARSIVRLRAVRAGGGLRERARILCERGRREARVIRGTLIGDRDDGPPSVGPAKAPGPAAVLHGDLNMLRCFTGSGVRVVTLAPDPDAPVFFSKHCGQRRVIADVNAAPEAALADLIALGRLLEDRPVLFYGDDALLLLVSRHRKALAARYRFLLPPADLVEALVDKLRFAALAEARGLPTPRTVTSAEARTAAEIARILPPPVILKPFSHLGFRTHRAVLDLHVGPAKAFVAGSVDELSRMIDRISSFSTAFVAQAYIPGGEDRVYSFHAYRDAAGRTLGRFAGRKIRTYPRHAGASTYVELVDEPALTRAGQDALDRLGLPGVVKLDFKRDPRDGRFYLLEVNPRFSLWNHLGAASGVNLPLLCYRDLTGARVEPAGPARPGKRWLSLADDVRTFVRDYGPAGEISAAAWLRSLCVPKVYDVFAWDDVSPFLVEAARAVRARHRRDRA